MMRKIKNKLGSRRGFTLIEVMIGMMILAIAIVSATNLLMGLIRANRENVSTLQAYYLAQEGLEAVRNIRDTNWLNNVDWIEGNSRAVQEYSFVKNNAYAVTLDERGWQSVGDDVPDLNSVKPWSVAPVGTVNNAEEDPYNGEFILAFEENDGFGVVKTASEFYRHINILPYDECGAIGADGVTDCSDFVLVQSVVNWKDGGDDRKVMLEEILTNWKGGVL